MDDRTTDQVISYATSDQQRVMRRHRASHTKSRNGCYNCKLRRVKCDELQPACGTCASRGELCSYPRPRLPPRKTPRSRKGNSGDDYALPIPDTLASPDDGPPPGLIEPLGGNTKLPAISWGQPYHGQENLAMDDLKLLQFFHMHTSSRMSRNPRRLTVWQRIIPEFASKNRYLMHLILALGGIHMVIKQAESSPNEDIEDTETVHMAVIEEHHQRGLEGFREQVACITSSNADHILAGSLLLVGFAFASLKVQKPIQSTEQHEEIHSFSRSSSTNEILRLNWLYLNRGVSSVMREKWNVLKSSRLRQMLIFPSNEEFWKDILFDAPSSRLSRCCPRLLKFVTGASDAVANLKAHLVSLEAPKDDSPYWSDTPTSQPPPSTTSDRGLEGHFAALETLDDTYSRIVAVLQCAATENSVDREIQMDFEEATILGWPVFLPPPFLSSLQVNENNALHGASLVLLAHFYLVNTLVDSWFLRGSFEPEIMKVGALVEALNDSPLSTLMVWPNEVIAMPTSSTP